MKKQMRQEKEENTKKKTTIKVQNVIYVAQIHQRIRFSGCLFQCIPAKHLISLLANLRGALSSLTFRGCYSVTLTVHLLLVQRFNDLSCPFFSKDISTSNKKMPMISFHLKRSRTFSHRSRSTSKSTVKFKSFYLYNYREKKSSCQLIQHNI